MPPGAKRVKAAPEAEPENKATSSAYNFTAARLIPKVATLPAELYDQIISQLDTLPECIDYKGSRKFAELSAHGFQERNEALRALSNACRATRAIFHPRLWERLDCVFVPRGRKIQWYKYIVPSTIQKLRGVRGDPALCRYVRIVSLTIPEANAYTLIAELVATLPILPNLHTIQLLGCKKPGPISQALSKCNLSSVRTVSIDPDAHSIARCCPNVTRVLCTSGTSVAMMNALRTTPNVTHFGGLFNWATGTALECAKALVKHSPNLTSLDLCDAQIHSPEARFTWILPVFGQLQHLRYLTITIRVVYREESDAIPTLSELEANERNAKVIEAAQMVMKSRGAVPSDVKRILVVRFMWAFANVYTGMREPMYETVHTYQ